MSRTPGAPCTPHPHPSANQRMPDTIERRTQSASKVAGCGVGTSVQGDGPSYPRAAAPSALCTLSLSRSWSSTCPPFPSASAAGAQA
eukprot:4186070-Prymnesium_polylepis.1